jgi:hypothetical protein
VHANDALARLGDLQHEALAPRAVDHVRLRGQALEPDEFLPVRGRDELFAVLREDE